MYFPRPTSEYSKKSGSLFLKITQLFYLSDYISIHVFYLLVSNHALLQRPTIPNNYGEIVLQMQSLRKYYLEPFLRIK